MTKIDQMCDLVSQLMNEFQFQLLSGISSHETIHVCVDRRELPKSLGKTLVARNSFRSGLSKLKEHPDNTRGHFYSAIGDMNMATIQDVGFCYREMLSTIGILEEFGKRIDSFAPAIRLAKYNEFKNSQSFQHHIRVSNAGTTEDFDRELNSDAWGGAIDLRIAAEITAIDQLFLTGCNEGIHSTLKKCISLGLLPAKLNGTMHDCHIFCIGSASSNH